MPLYFAYGANLDPAGMAARCPASRPLGLARLPRHRFLITRAGYATVVRDARCEVEGVLWNLALADVPALDKFEEVARGLYTKALQPVLTTEGSRRAMVYLATDAQPGPARAGYLEAVIAHAEGWGFTPAYLAMLRQLMRRAPASPPPELKRAGPVAGVTPRAERPHSTLNSPAPRGTGWRWGE